MIKVVLIVVALILFVREFWFLVDLNKNLSLDSIKINTQKLPPISEQNISLEEFFDRGIWILTKADQMEEIEDESMLEDTNTTITVINRKNSKQLCRGKKCMTIKGFLSDTLLLEDGDKIVTLKLSQMIFDKLKFVRFTDTKLFFENNQSKEIYELEFFTYKQVPDINETNETNKTEKQKDTK